jgi:tRNA threonylcarbamoyladenosine biosynthesis protein TsaE
MDEPAEIVVDSLQGLTAAAREVLALADSRIFLVTGEMGAGKTTFIKSLCEALGSRDHFSSPTYSIVNEYAYPGGKIFHFDLYRIEHSSELLDLGIDEYLAGGEYCFFEWPEKVGEFHSGKVVEIKIRVSHDKRYIRASHKQVY